MGKRSPVLGVDVSQVSTADEFGLGAFAQHEGTEYIWVKSESTIAAKVPAKIDADFVIAASGNGGSADVITTQAVDDGDYHWAAIRGLVTGVNVAEATAAEALLARKTDANGDLVTVHATGAAAGDVTARAKAITEEASDVATVWLF